MFYRKNLPGWERAARAIAGLGRPQAAFGLS